MRKRSLTLVELLICVCVILILLGVFSVYMNEVLKVSRETALINELVNIRMSIENYRIINGELPEDLSVLLRKDFTLRRADGIILENKFLEPFRIDKQGSLLDPFRNRYIYDKQAGTVHSQSRSYENW